MKQSRYSHPSVPSQSLGEQSVGWKQLSLGLQLAIFGLWWIVFMALGYVLAEIL